MPDSIMLDIEEKMENCISSLKSQFTKVRTGRANPRVLDGINAEYYGVLTPLNQLANISVPDAQQLVIKPFDKTCLANIEKAVNQANIGLNPNNDGDVIRIAVPTLTEDIRKELAKKVKKTAEETKIVIRNIRRDGNDSFKKIEKDGSITEDELKEYHDDVQKLTDSFIKKIDELGKQKEKDLMTI